MYWLYYVFNSRTFCPFRRILLSVFCLDHSVPVCVCVCVDLVSREVYSNFSSILAFSFFVLKLFFISFLFIIYVLDKFIFSAQQIKTFHFRMMRALKQMFIKSDSEAVFFCYFSFFWNWLIWMERIAEFCVFFLLPLSLRFHVLNFTYC